MNEWEWPTWLAILVVAVTVVDCYGKWEACRECVRRDGYAVCEDWCPVVKTRDGK